MTASSLAKLDFWDSRRVGLASKSVVVVGGVRSFDRFGNKVARRFPVPGPNSTR